jgi:hypothetical protein
MTFIVTSLCPHDIVITADSRAVLEKGGNFQGVIDNFQKIFPIPDHPVVIAHHGENELDRKPLDKFVGNFIARINTGNMTILDIADEFRSYAHPAVRACLKELGDFENHGCGFLIAGFGADDRGPSVVELFWKFREQALVTDEKQWFPPSIISSGSGAGQAERLDVGKIIDCPVEKVREYNDRLLDEAINAAVKQNTVGGSIHEVVVTREKWEWARPPGKPVPTTGPGTRGT